MIIDMKCNVCHSKIEVTKQKSVVGSIVTCKCTLCNYKAIYFLATEKKGIKHAEFFKQGL